MTRTNLSQRLRFEVLKRDQFKCAYCGKGPPEVLLEVDHILPVVEGGTNDPVNLIAACHSCNSGKSGVPLSRVLPSQVEIEKQERDRFQQIQQLNQWLQDKNNQMEDWLIEVSDIWMTAIGSDPEEYRVSGDLETAIRQFLKRLPCEEVKESVRITFARNRGVPHNALRYFCGVCWSKIRDLEIAKETEQVGNEITVDNGAEKNTAEPRKEP